MFSKILRQLRLEQKFTQSEMAKALNISRVAYTNYELGNREPSLATMTRIAAILGTSVDYLLGNSSVRGAPSGYGSIFEAAMKPSLRLLMLSATDLSSESREDLQKYIELLALRDRSMNGRIPLPDDKRHRSGRSKNGGGSTSL